MKGYLFIKEFTKVIFDFRLSKVAGLAGL